MLNNDARRHLIAEQSLQFAQGQTGKKAQKKADALLDEPCAVVPDPTDGCGLLLPEAVRLQFCKPLLGNALMNIHHNPQSIFAWPRMNQQVGHQILIQREINVLPPIVNLHRKLRRGSPTK